MKIKDIISELERCFPLCVQENYDNAGFQVFMGDQDIDRCLVCLDVTEAVVNEAVRKDCRLIISHHPIIFGKGLLSLTGASPIEKTVMLAIQNSISIYSAHTNVDSMPEGTSRVMMNKIGIQNYKILVPNKLQDFECGIGAIGDLPCEMETMDFLRMLKDKFQCGSIKYSTVAKERIKRVAVCSGAGSSLLKEAIRQGADVFVSGDFTYHKYFEADGKILIADLGHFETEIGIKDVFVDVLQKKFINFVVLKSEINTNPINYL